MAPHKPASPDRQLKIGGRDFTIRFSIRAVMALQDRWGLASEEEVQERLKNPKNKIGDFVDILWASLRTHHPSVTPEDVMDLVDAAGLEDLAKAAQDAIVAAMPPAEAKPRGPKAAAAETTR